MRTLKLTSNQVKILKYEMNYVIVALDQVKRGPVDDLGDNLKILDDNILILYTNLEKVFGDPWAKERSRARVS